MPAAIRRSSAAGLRLGGAWMLISGAEDQARHGDRPQMLVERGLGRCRHARAGLGAEVLDDDLLHMAVARRAARAAPAAPRCARARVSPMPIRMPVVNGTARLAGEPDGLEADRRAACRASRNAARRARTSRAELGLQHQPGRHRDRAQPLEVGRAHHAGIDVRQQAGLLEHPPRDLGEIVERGRVAQRGQRLARHAVAALGLVAEREQRLVAAGRGAGLRDRQHLVDRQIGRLQVARRMREGAVVADVAAQLGERDEHFPRVADDARAPGRGARAPPQAARPDRPCASRASACASVSAAPAAASAMMASTLAVTCALSCDRPVREVSLSGTLAVRRALQRISGGGTSARTSVSGNAALWGLGAGAGRGIKGRHP